MVANYNPFTYSTHGYFCIYNILFSGFQPPTETYDEYPWMSCNSFEATRKNCPRGEACLKLKQYQEYAWSWAMKCKFTLDTYQFVVLRSRSKHVYMLWDGWSCGLLRLGGSAGKGRPMSVSTVPLACN